MLIDFIISNYRLSNVILNYFPVVNIDSHHPPLELHFSVESDTKYYLLNDAIKYNWVQAHYASIINALGSIQWANYLIIMK